MPPKKGPAWAEYKEQPGSTKDKPINKCNHCKTVIIGTYPRLLAHLIGKAGSGVRLCPGVPETVVARLSRTALEKAATQARRDSLRQLDVSTSADSSAVLTASSKQQPQSRQPGIAAAFNKAGKAAVCT